jgi:hypothetical protein
MIYRLLGWIAQLATTLPIQLALVGFASECQDPAIRIAGGWDG